MFYVGHKLLSFISDRNSNLHKLMEISPKILFLESEENYF